MVEKFRVQKRMCKTCIYRPDSPLDVEKLEAQVMGEDGMFKTHRQCHHTEGTPACCAGFWAKNGDRYPLGVAAEKLIGIEYVDLDELETKMAVEVDAATEGPFEWIGEGIEKSGQEDSSGLRRFLAGCVMSDDKLPS